MKKETPMKEWKNYAGATVSNAASLFGVIMPNSRNLITSTKKYVIDNKRVKTDETAEKTAVRNNSNILDGAMRDLSSGNYSLDKTSNELMNDYESQTARLFDIGHPDSDSRSKEQISADNSRGVAQSIVQSSSAQLRGLEQVSKSIINSNIMINKTSVNTISKTMFFGIDTIKRTQGVIINRLDNISSGINSIVEFNNANTLQYYSKSLDMLNEMGIMFSNTNKMNEKRYNNSKVFDDGTFNVKNYLDKVVDGVKSTAMGTTLKVLSADIAESSATVAHEMAATALNIFVPSLTKPLKEFDESVNLLLRGSLKKLGKNSILKAFGLDDVIGIKESRINNAKLGRYDKNAMSWNGVAQKALIEVIPELLTSIDSKLDKSEKRYFDYETGEFKSSSRLEKDFQTQIISTIDSNIYDIMSELNSSIKNFSEKGEENDKRIYEDIKKLIESRIFDEKTDDEFRYAVMDKLASANIPEKQIYRLDLKLQSKLDAAIDAINDTYANIDTGYSAYRNLSNKSSSTNNATERLQDNLSKNTSASIASNSEIVFNPVSGLQSIIDAYSENIDPLVLSDTDYLNSLAKSLMAGETEDNIVKALFRESGLRRAKRAYSNSKFAKNTKIGSIASKFIGDGDSRYEGYAGVTKTGKKLENLSDTAFRTIYGKIGPIRQTISTDPTDTASATDNKASSKAEAKSDAPSNNNAVIAGIMNEINVPFNNIVARSDGEVKNRHEKLNLAVQSITSSLNNSTIEDSIISSNDMLQATMGSMLVTLQDILSYIYKGETKEEQEEKKKEEKEKIEKYKTALFTGDKAIFKKQYEAGKTKVLNFKDKVVNELEGGYDKAYDYTMQYMYGKDYATSDKYLSNELLSKTMNRKQRAEEAKKKEAEQRVSSTNPEANLVDKVGDVVNEVGKLEANVKAASETLVGDTDTKPEEKAKKFKNTFFSKLKKTMPKAVAAGIGGAAIGAMNSEFSILGSMFLPGGPVTGAIVGSGLAILSQTEAFKTFMFGKMDKNTNERSGGLISKKMSEKFKSMLPMIAGGAIVGGLKSIVTGAIGVGGAGMGVFGAQLLPAGILGGAMLGAGISMVKNSEKIKDMLFGPMDEDGKRSGKLISKSMNKAKDGMSKSMPFLKKAFGGLGVGALTGLVLKSGGYIPAMLSMGGPVGMGVVGLGLGIASTSKKFNEFMFGTQALDKDGNPIEGKRDKDGLMNRTINLIKTNTIEPISIAFKKNMLNLIDWSKDKITYPFRLAFGPILDSFKGIKDNISDITKDTFTNLSGGIMNIFKSFTKKLMSPFTKAIGFIGKTMLGAGSLGAKLALSPFSVGLQGMQMLTAGTRRKEYKEFYKNYLFGGGRREGLQQYWDAQEADGKKRNFMQKAADSFGSRVGIGAVADAAREGYNNQLAASGRNHLNWRSVGQERREMRDKAKKRKISDGNWTDIDKLRSSIINKDLNGREVNLSDFALKDYQEKFAKLGIGKDQLKTSDDVMKLLYNRTEFKSAHEAALAAENAVSPAEKKFWEDTGKYQTNVERALEEISVKFGIIGKKVSDEKDLKSINEDRQKNLSRIKKTMGKKEYKSLLRNINLDGEAFSDYTFADITDDDIKDYKLSDYSKTNDFKKFLDEHKGAKKYSDVNVISSENAEETAPVVNAEAVKEAKEPGTMFDAIVSNEVFSDKTDTLISSVMDLPNRIAKAIFDAKAGKLNFKVEEDGPHQISLDEHMAESNKTLQTIAETTIQNNNIQSAQLEANTAGEIDPEKVEDGEIKKTSFFERIHAKSSKLTGKVISSIFKKNEDAEDAEAEQDAQDEAARGLGKDKSKDDTTAVTMQTLPEKIGMSIANAFDKFSESTLGKGLIGLTKFGSAVLSGGLLLEAIKPGTIGKITNGLSNAVTALGNFNDNVESGKYNSEFFKAKFEDMGKSVQSTIDNTIIPWWENVAVPKMEKKWEDAKISFRDSILPTLKDTGDWIADNSEQIVNGFVDFIKVAAPPLIEAIIKSLPSIIGAFKDAIFTVGKNIGGDILDTGKGYFGGDASDGGAGAKGDLTANDAEALNASGVNIRTKREGSFTSITEATKYAKSKGYENAKVSINEDGTFAVSTQLASGNNVFINDDGDMENVKRTGNLNDSLLSVITKKLMIDNLSPTGFGSKAFNAGAKSFNTVTGLGARGGLLALRGTNRLAQGFGAIANKFIPGGKLLTKAYEPLHDGINNALKFASHPIRNTNNFMKAGTDAVDEVIADTGRSPGLITRGASRIANSIKDSRAGKAVTSISDKLLGGAKSFGGRMSDAFKAGANFASYGDIAAKNLEIAQTSKYFKGFDSVNTKTMSAINGATYGPQQPKSSFINNLSETATSVKNKLSATFSKFTGKPLATAAETAENVADIATDIVEHSASSGVGADTVNAVNKSTLASQVEKIKKYLSELKSNKTILKVFDKFSKTGGKLLGELCKYLAKFAGKILSIPANLASKAVSLITAAIAKFTGKVATEAITAGIGAVIFAGTGAIFGAVATANLFGVKEEDVTPGMRATSSVLEALLSLSYGTWLDLFFALADLAKFGDFKRELAEKIYLMFADDDKNEKETLKQSQDKLKIDAMVYNDVNNTNLSTEAYNDLINKTGLSKAVAWITNIGNKTETDELKKISDEIISDKSTYASFVAMDSIEQSEFISDKINAKSERVGGYGPSKNNAKKGNSKSQGNSEWSEMILGRLPGGGIATMANAGCGPTTMANVINTLKGDDTVSPADVANFAKSNGYITEGGANVGLFTSGAAKMGIPSEKLGTTNELQMSLVGGRPVVIAGSSNGADDPFTKAGHIVMADGVYKDKVRILDPMTGKHKYYSLDKVSRNATDAWAYGGGSNTVNTLANYKTNKELRARLGYDGEVPYGPTLPTTPLPTTLSSTSYISSDNTYNMEDHGKWLEGGAARRSSNSKGGKYVDADKNGINDYFDPIDLPDDLKKFIVDAAVKNDIPPALMFALAKTESGFNTSAIGHNTNGTADYGLFQLNSDYHDYFGKMIGEPINTTTAMDPYISTKAGIAILKGNLGDSGTPHTARNWNEVLMKYNKGASGAYNHHFSIGEYTNEYSEKVRANAKEYGLDSMEFDGTPNKNYTPVAGGDGGGVYGANGLSGSSIPMTATAFGEAYKNASIMQKLQMMLAIPSAMLGSVMGKDFHQTMGTSVNSILDQGSNSTGGTPADAIPGTMGGSAGSGLPDSLTGNELDRMLTVANSQVGYLEKASESGIDTFATNAGNNEYTKYAREIGNANGGKQYWCNYFTSWVAKAAGISDTTIPKLAGCDYSEDAFIKQNRYFFRGEGTPAPGDLVFYNWDMGANTNPRTVSDAQHIELVTGFDGTKINVIGGNTATGITGPTDPRGQYDKVAALSRTENNVIGYARPNYSTTSTTIRPKENLKLGYGNIDTNKDKKILSLMDHIKPSKNSHPIDNHNYPKAVGYGTGPMINNTAIYNSGSTDSRLDKLITILLDWKVNSLKRKEVTSTNTSNVIVNNDNAPKTVITKVNENKDTSGTTSLVQKHLSLSTRVNARK